MFPWKVLRKTRWVVRRISLQIGIFCPGGCNLHTVGIQGFFHGHWECLWCLPQIKAGNPLQGNLPGAGGVRLLILSPAHCRFPKNLAEGFAGCRLPGGFRSFSISFSWEIGWLDGCTLTLITQNPSMFGTQKLEVWETELCICVKTQE